MRPRKNRSVRRVLRKRDRLPRARSRAFNVRSAMLPTAMLLNLLYFRIREKYVLRATPQRARLVASECNLLRKIL